jgi:uncharacterized protein (DUF1778 family)
MALVKENPLNEHSRLNVRLSKDIKARIQRAANILGQDLTEFTKDTLNTRAINVIESAERIALKEEEYRFFLEYLDAPPAKPSKKTLKALDVYRKNVKRVGRESK